MIASSPALETRTHASQPFGGVLIGRLKAYHLATRAPLGAMLTVLHLALIYGLGLLAAAPEARSGVDVVRGFLLARLGVDGYVGVHIGVASIVIGYACWKHRRSRIYR